MAVRWYKEDLAQAGFIPATGSNMVSNWVPFKSKWALNARQFWVYTSGRRGPDDPEVGDFSNCGFYFTIAGFDSIASMQDPDAAYGTLGWIVDTVPGSVDGADVDSNIMFLQTNDGHSGLYLRRLLIDMGEVDPYPVMAIRFVGIAGDWPSISTLSYPSDAPKWCNTTILYKIED